MTRLLSFVFAIPLAACSCPTPDADAGPDAGGSDAITPDAQQGDAGSDGAQDDAGESACQQVSAVSWRIDRDEDVRVGYEASLDERIDGSTVSLLLWFERYNDTEYTGTFDMSMGPDNNFGTCAHCIWARSLTNPDLLFYAEEGIFEARADPFTRSLDARSEGLRLVQVTLDETRVSTPVPDGLCIEIADFDVDEVYTTEGWTCDMSLFNDGQCHCDCGAGDPDCNGVFPNPGPEPVDCDATEICGYNIVSDGPACLDRCDVDGVNTCGSANVCLPDTGNEGIDRCAVTLDIVTAAMPGEECVGPPANFAAFCNVVDGAARGYCDDDRICRRLCESEEDCEGTGFPCTRFRGDGTGRGWCGQFADDG